MCGIIGYVGSKNAVPIIVEGLKKLEYRGYDSAGIAVYGADGFKLVKQKGRLAALESRLTGCSITGTMGIGHTRWATHGEPSDVNSHPHMGNQSKIVIVHNGIIENYKQLKERLQQKGIHFVSQTDSEVIAQLAEYYYKGDILDTVEIAILRKESINFFNLDKEPIQKTLETVIWSLDSAEKGGYPHFMLKEIMEQPKVLKDTIQSAINTGDNKKVIDNIDIAHFNKIVITACGSAYNAGVVGKYVFESLCRVSVEVELASEFRYKDPIIDEKTLVILVSQSGEIADTIAAMREAKSKGAATLTIVNVIGSTIAKEADQVIYTIAGPEIAVATTKAFSAQLVLLYLLAVQFAFKLGKLSQETEQELLSEIKDLPGKIAEILEQVDSIQKYASTCVGYKSIFFIGRNIDYAIALEGSLKLKEISYIHSEAYAGGELKHGTISLIEEDTLVVAISNSKRLCSKIMSNVEQVISRGAKVLLIGNCIETEPSDKLSFIGLPESNELFSASLSVIALQLFSYYVAENKSLDIDKPRNLAKSVTVE